MIKGILSLLALVGWVNLVVRIYMKITTSGMNVFDSLLQFFSYFTVLTNLLVTIYCTVNLFSSDQEKRNNLFLRQETLTALTVFIIMVASVYHFVLRSLWRPTGLLMITDEIYHTVVPIGTLALWLLTVKKDYPLFKNLISWLLYPVLYLFFVLISGSFSDFYPYPFLDVAELGIATVITNALLLLLVGSFLLVLFYFIEKKILMKSTINKS